MKKTIHITFFLVVHILVFWASFLCYSDNAYAQSKKLEKPDKLFEIGRYEDAIKAYKKKIKKNRNLSYYNFMIGECYRKTSRPVKAIPYYKNAITSAEETDTTAPPYAYLQYGKSLKVLGDYTQARTYLEKYMAFGKEEEILRQIQHELDNLSLLEKIKEKKSYIKIRNLTAINTDKAEFAPYYYKKKLYFTSNAHKGKLYKADGTYFSNIYQVQFTDHQAKMSTLEEVAGVNSKDVNDASINISERGSFQVFAKGNSGKLKGSENVHIYGRVRRRGKWGEPFMLSLNKKGYWDSCPFLLKDSQTLYFASNRPGGYGGTDLYSAKISTYGKWKNIKNLGPEINTAGNEMFPFLADNGVLYFSSDGHPGFGGLDLFTATLKRGKYEIESMGVPLNSPKDDFGVFYYNEKEGFFASNREGGKGSDDIYAFINDDPAFKTVSYALNITTYEKVKNGDIKILPQVSIKLLNAEGKELNTGDSSEEGKMSFVVNEDNDYIILGQKDHYISRRKVWSMEGRALNKELLKEEHTHKIFSDSLTFELIDTEKIFRINNILYEFDKATLRKDSYKELDNLIQIMKDNPHISIELSSHTDNLGTDEYNRDLSQRRAESAVRYILNEGKIKTERIVAKGYGESKPVAPNTNDDGTDNPEGRQLNRRTEFRITSYDKLAEDVEIETPDIETPDTENQDNPNQNDEEPIEIDLNDLLEK